MTQNPYRCEECGGTGQMICPCCEQETECDVCEGSGLNDRLLDVERFQEAEEVFQKKHRITWAWIVDGEWKGRTTRNGDTLAYQDFLRKP